MRVIVCGTGMAGLALAHRLHALGQEVVLLERSTSPRDEGYMIDFFGPGLDAARELGLLPALRKIAYPITEAVLVDERGRRRAGIDTAQVADGEVLSLMRPDLEHVLRDQLPLAINIRYGAPVVEVDPDGPQVTLADGTTLAGDVVIGADGIHSTVRQLAFGPESQYLRHLGFHTSAFIFDDPQIRDRVAGRFCLTDTIGAQFGCYPLRDGRVAAFGVHRSTDPALPTDAQTAMRTAYGELGWVVPEALAACPPELYYDQVAQIVMPTWHNGRVGLVGDACQAVSLLAGQGASLAIAGAYVLGGELARAESPEAAFTAYERIWRPVVEEKQQVGRSAARWFLPASRTQLLVRRLMLRTLKLPVLRRRIPAALAGKSTTLIRDLS
ncbi:FAD-dependent oxidoreductase [Kribbella sandramycini]|uniref:FAD-dependent oxidoreductase n=1 Tax=Kribbella sandramycini TaxID=60450 RepID=A0A7Y4P4U6_9ACTN|nr:FAD-dependent monooxygenase [Kribbella sandramycini]MBB6566729.1 2-polyprenyl-6-methoxyphenol hydroxylase-like FAD-dependent oxidoreductase [Kribbella sandramycini]NOL45515.1 FAD-dependent oxidoreductase [Kribbella sandramycini]